MCFSSLGLNHVPPDAFVFSRSHLLPRYITAYSGHTLVLQASMQQVVVDFYNRETGIDVDGPALVEDTWFVFFYC